MNFIEFNVYNMKFFSDQVVNMSGAQLIQQLAGSCGDVLDMPVDPNEPTYCICHQVSHGEMVACDNDDVNSIFYLFFLSV